MGKPPGSGLKQEGEEMRITGSVFGRYKAKKQGRVIKIRTSKGKTKKIRLNKCLPKGCSTPRRVCVKCLVSVIHKLDKNYDSKICKQCETGK